MSKVMGSLWLWNAANADPDPGGCSSGDLCIISSCCNTGTVPQWWCQGVLGRATTGWVSSKVQWDEHVRSSAEIAEVAQEWFVLAQSSQGLGITPWSLCSELSHPLTSTLPGACPGCQMSGKTNWEEVTADVLIFITNLGMCGVIFHTRMERLPCWKELVRTLCKNMWLWQLFSESVTLGWGSQAVDLQGVFVSSLDVRRYNCSGTMLQCSFTSPGRVQGEILSWLLCGLTNVFPGLPAPWACIVLLQTGISSWAVVQALIACSEGMVDTLVKYFGKNITDIGFVTSPPVAGRVLWVVWHQNSMAGSEARGSLWLGNSVGKLWMCAGHSVEPGQALSVRQSWTQDM